MSDELEKRETLCIRCPKGCRLALKIDEEVIVKGNQCKIGEDYGKQEGREPKRIVPTTVKIKDAKWPRIPVRTEESISLDKVKEVIEAVEGVVVEAPIEKGEIVINDVADTSVNIIAERDMEKIR